MPFNFNLVLILCFLINGQFSKEPTQDEPFNFDIEKKTSMELPSCHWNYQYDIARSVISGLCFLMGAFILILGYRHRRISFCFIGVSSASIFTYLVLISEGKFSILINILISLAVGLFVSFFTTMLIYCGCFITGLFAGFVLGFLFLLVYTSFTTVGSVALPCVIVAIFGLVQVFVTMWWRHRVYIFSCCVFASAIMASSLDYFIEDLFLYRYMEMKIFYSRVATLCWWSYLVFGIMPVLFIIGLLVQCLLTGKDRQKEEYTFIYRRREVHTEIHDDMNRLL